MKFIVQCLLFAQLVCSVAVAQYPPSGAPQQQQQQPKSAPKQQGYGQSKGNTPSSSSPPAAAQQQQSGYRVGIEPPLTGNDLPNVVGMDVDQAVQVIKDYDPSLQVTKFPPGSMGTHDVRKDRVRVRFDPETNKVVKQPGRG